MKGKGRGKSKGEKERKVEKIRIITKYQVSFGSSAMSKYWNHVSMRKLQNQDAKVTGNIPSENSLKRATFDVTKATTPVKSIFRSWDHHIIVYEKTL